MKELQESEIENLRNEMTKQHEDMKRDYELLNQKKLISEMKTRLEEQVQIDTMESMAKEIEVTKEEMKTHTN